MNITVKLGGALVKYAPPDTKGSSHELSLPENANVQHVLDRFQVPAEQPLMIILNDAMVARPNYPTTILNDGDSLALMPPITAG